MPSDGAVGKAIPLAYLITFACYGARLHGHQSGSVDRNHNVKGTDFLPADPKRLSAERKQMKQATYLLDKPGRRIVLNAIVESQLHKGWRVLAAHVRRNHAHVVVQAQETPEKVLIHFKSYASRALNRAGREVCQRMRWSRHGSTRYLWKPGHVRAAIEYVIREQGEAMAVWESAEPIWQG